MILSIVLFLAAVICYSIKELQAFNKLKWQDENNNFFSFWGRNSWVRKYAGDHHKAAILEKVKNPNWYYRFFKIKHKERFPLSATLLVFVTDGYHLMQFFYKLLFCAAFYPLTNWWFPVILWVLWGATFTLCDKFLTK